MALMLTSVELRVLGVLIEKSLAHPGSYPLTLNAVSSGANQRQNREPVLQLTEAEVATALYTLTQKQLVKPAPPEPGARANRFLHNVVERFHWDRRAQAVMAELLLRGSQTPGELRTRACRMTPIPDLEAVRAILDGLTDGDRAFIEELPREPGRSANRFRHLLLTEETVEAPPVTTAPVMAASRTVGSASGGVRSDGSLEQRVARLEEQVAHLTDAVTGLQKSGREAIDQSDAPVV